MENESTPLNASSEPSQGRSVLKPGVTVDSKFQLIEEIGRGAFGVIFKARHITLDQIVAVKFIDEQFVDAPTSMQRFHNEAKILSAFDHPNIVHFLTYSTNPGSQQYIVMEFLDGISLDEFLKSKTPDQKMLIAIFKQVLSGLGYAHEKGIVHRDIKPANIFLIGNGDSHIAKLIDFGIFKIENDTTHGLTKTGLAVGSANYMSPEQCRAQSLDRRADFYSLGCVMYECVVGEPPMVADNDLLVMTNQLEKIISKVPAIIPVSKGFVSIILKCLEKNRENRFSSAEELVQALENEEDASTGVPVTHAGVNKRLGLILLLLIVCVVGLLGPSLFGPRTSADLQNIKIKQAASAKNKSEQLMTLTKFPEPLYPPNSAIQSLSGWLGYALSNKFYNTEMLADALRRLRDRYCAMLNDDGKLPYEDRVIDRIKEVCDRDSKARNTESSANLNIHDNIERLRNLAVAQRAAQRYGDALETLKKAKALRDKYPQFGNTTYADALGDFSFIEEYEGHYAEAARYIQTALELDKERDHEHLQRLANLYEHAGDFEKAIQNSKKALKSYDQKISDGYFASPVVTLCTSLVGLGQAKEVINFLDKHYKSFAQLNEGAVASEADFIVGIRALAYKKLNRSDDAIETYKQAVAMAKERNHLTNAISFLKSLIELLLAEKKSCSAEKQELLSLTKGDLTNYSDSVGFLESVLNPITESDPSVRKLFDSQIEFLKKSDHILCGKMLYQKSCRLANQKNWRGTLSLLIQAEREFDCDKSESGRFMRYTPLAAELNTYGILCELDNLNKTYKRCLDLKGISPQYDFACARLYGDNLAKLDYANGVAFLEKLIAEWDQKSIRNLADYFPTVKKLCMRYKGADREKITGLLEKAIRKLNDDRHAQISEQIQLLDQLRLNYLRLKDTKNSELALAKMVKLQKLEKELGH